MHLSRHYSIPVFKSGECDAVGEDPGPRLTTVVGEGPETMRPPAGVCGSLMVLEDSSQWEPRQGLWDFNTDKQFYRVFPFGSASSSPIKKPKTRKIIVRSEIVIVVTLYSDE